MISKSQINKLGKNIRTKFRNKESLLDEELELLQSYRTSFKDDLSSVFNEVISISKSERKDSIISFRIKRIESILSKIKREPTMALGNMGDIAGCRVIVYTHATLKKLVNSINSKFDVTSFNDYTQEPKYDGYRGYHLYVKSPLNEHRIIEIQLRFIKTHKWASLVEIIDTLYDLKLKEGQEHKELQEFLIILSKDIEEVTYNEKKRVLDIDSMYNLHTKLSEVFVKNYFPIRNKWLSISNFKSNNHFIFEVNEEKKSDIMSFSSYNEAEEKYYEMFKTHKSSNVVLAFIENPNFKNICVAYASYMLVKHDYLEDYWNSFAKEIIFSSSQNNKIYTDYIERNLIEQKKQFQKEINEVTKCLKEENLDPKQMNGIKEWIEDLKNNQEEINTKMEEINKMTNNETRKSILSKFFN